MYCKEPLNLRQWRSETYYQLFYIVIIIIIIIIIVLLLLLLLLLLQGHTKLKVCLLLLFLGGLGGGTLAASFIHDAELLGEFGVCSLENVRIIGSLKYPE